jgi:hypothetical protein
MSKKHGSWELTEAQRQELVRVEALREAQHAAQGARRMLEKVLDELKRAQAKAVEAPHFPIANNLEAFETYTRQALEAADEARAELARVRALADLKQLMARIEAEPKVAYKPELGREHNAASDPDVQLNRQAIIQQIERIVSRSSPEAMQEDRKDVDELVQQLLRAPAHDHDAMISQLRGFVQKAHDRQRRDQRGRNEARQILKEMRGLTGGDLAGVRAELEMVADGAAAPDSQLSMRARSLAERARQRAEADYAAKVMKEELENLGYTVNDEFANSIREGGQTIIMPPARSSDAPEPGVAISLAANGTQLDFDMVRYADVALTPEQEARNREVERAWTQEHLNAFRQSLRSRGIDVVIDRIEQATFSRSIERQGGRKRSTEPAKPAAREKPQG